MASCDSSETRRWTLKELIIWPRRNPPCPPHHASGPASCPSVQLRSPPITATIPARSCWRVDPSESCPPVTAGEGAAAADADRGWCRTPPLGLTKRNWGAPEAPRPVRKGTFVVVDGAVEDWDAAVTGNLSNR
ncbi:hypothetical protein H6P81_003139 [Aristolochia fimbriata]|uniref:Uncharacterized protein n=1 Tax=Aristolochia fimbriata TaxID=158543 RepID=A0AAV7FCU9_ARIFI|nr:hypothetical protein H6P81_003139 [Aristolochia fimbriata]